MTEKILGPEKKKYNTVLIDGVSVKTENCLNEVF